MGKRSRNRAGRVIHAMISGVGALTAHAEIQQAAAAALTAPFGQRCQWHRIGRTLLTCDRTRSSTKGSRGSVTIGGRDWVDALGTSGALYPDWSCRFVGDHIG